MVGSSGTAAAAPAAADATMVKERWWLWRLIEVVVVVVVSRRDWRLAAEVKTAPWVARRTCWEIELAVGCF